MPDFDLILAGRKIRYRKFSVLVGDRIIWIVYNDNVALHPTVDCAFDVYRACLLDFLLVDLALNRLRNIEEAVVALEELDVVQYGITVTQRDLGVHRHDLNMR